MSSGGGYAPDVLPGLSPWYRSGRVHLVVCANCGLVRFFADREALRELPASGKWERI